MKNTILMFLLTSLIGGCIPTGGTGTGTGSFTIRSPYAAVKYKEVRCFQYITAASTDIITDSALSQSLLFTYNTQGYVSKIVNKELVANNDTAEWKIDYTYSNNEMNFNAASFNESGTVKFNPDGTVKQYYLLNSTPGSSYAFNYYFTTTSDTVYYSKKVSNVVKDTGWFFPTTFMYEKNPTYYNIPEQFNLLEFRFGGIGLISFNGELINGSYQQVTIPGSAYVQSAGFPIGFRHGSLLKDSQAAGGSERIEYFYQFDINGRVSEVLVKKYMSSLNIHIPLLRTEYTYY